MSNPWKNLKSDYYEVDFELDIHNILKHSINRHDILDKLLEDVNNNRLKCAVFRNPYKPYDTMDRKRSHFASYIYNLVGSVEKIKMRNDIMVVTVSFVDQKYGKLVKGLTMAFGRSISFDGFLGFQPTFK